MKFQSLQYLRAIAAMMVIIMHLIFQVNRLGGHLAWEFISELHGGVDIFFVISGFVMWTSTQNRSTTTLSFWRNRVIRIVPMYWLLTTVVVITAVLMPGALLSTKLDSLHALMSYLFIPWPNPAFEGNAATWPILVVGWSINFEMAFYLVFGLCLLMARRHPMSGDRRLVAFGIVLVMSVLAALHYTALSDVPVASFYFSYRNLEFAAGVVLAYVLTGQQGHIDQRVSFGLVAIGAVLIPIAVKIVGVGDLHDDLFLASACLIVGGAVAYERVAALPKVWLLLLIGEASYSIYLSHSLTLSLVGQVWKHVPYGSTEPGLVAFAGGALAASVAVGIFLHIAIEQPLIRLLRGRRSQLGLDRPLWTGLFVGTIREAS